MGFTETLLFYAVIGVAVAAAVWSQDDFPSTPRKAGRAMFAVPFWPIYIPILLTPRAATPLANNVPSPTQEDDLSRRIREVEQEMNAALGNPDGWAAGTLLREKGRIPELHSAWSAQAQKIRDMDTVLAQASMENEDDASACPSERARRANIERLRRLRLKAHNDLMMTLSRVRELVSLIHLARFTGEPASRTDELLAELAASVHGVSEVAAWEDSPDPMPSCREAAIISR